MGLLFLAQRCPCLCHPNFCWRCDRVWRVIHHIAGRQVWSMAMLSLCFLFYKADDSVTSYETRRSNIYLSVICRFVAGLESWPILLDRGSLIYIVGKVKSGRKKQRVTVPAQRGSNGSFLVGWCCSLWWGLSWWVATCWIADISR